MLTSQSQRRVHKASQYNTNNYNLYCIIDSKKILTSPEWEIDRSKVIDCLNELVKRHSVLSSRFAYEGSVLMSRPVANVSIQLETISCDLLDQDTTIQELLKNTTFELHSDSLLMKPFVLVTKDNKESLLIIFHHIVFDGWSSSIFEKEFIKLYNNETLPLLDYSYQDYCVWEQEYLKSSRFQRSLEWWKENCKPNLVNDFPYDSLASSSSYSLVYTQSIQNSLLTEKWKKYITDYKVSSYQLFQIILALTFWCITSQRTIVLNGITTNRPNLKSEKLIGMFVNTVVYPYIIDPDSTFDEFVKQARKLFYQVITHSQVPYEYISSGNPQVMTTTSLEQSLSSSSSSSKLRCTRIPSKFDLSISVEVSDLLSTSPFRGSDQISIQWLYREGMFLEDTIQKLGNVFETVLSLVEPHLELNYIKESIQVSTFFPRYLEIKE